MSGKYRDRIEEWRESKGRKKIRLSHFHQVLTINVNSLLGKKSPVLKPQSGRAAKLPVQKAKKAGSVFQRLFRKQKSKVSTNKNVSNVLKTFAEDDYQRIASLIQAWLDKDEKQGRH